MFIARSAARVRLARTLFLIGGVLPCAALVAWAIWLKSDGRRDAVRDRWQAVVGLPLAIGSVEQPRPGVIRARRCAILGADGRTLVEMPMVELESSVDEDRLRIDSFRCDAGVATVLAGLGREWLGRDVRFPRSCVVEVADFSWRAPAPLPPMVDAAAITGLRVECVAHDASRAIRIVRRGDEARVVRTPPSADGAEESITCDAAWKEPVPLGVIAEFVGCGGSSAAAASSATVAGAVEARTSPAGWCGTARGRIEGIDIAACARALDSQAAGRATVAVERLVWNAGRLTDAVVSCEVGAGWVDGRLFDRFTVALGCRPGPAAPAAAAERSFDAAGMVLQIGADGLRVSPLPGLGGAIATARGGVVLQPPAGPVAIDRLAWMMAPPGTVFVPAEGPGAWLMSVLAPGGGEAAADRSGRSDAGGKAGGERGF